MKYSFKLANKIRTKILLFIDEEIRTKENNNLCLNKARNNFSRIYKIINQKESFSYSQKDDILYLIKLII